MSQFSKSTYEYTKVRKDFGKQPMFQQVPAQMLDSIYPDKAAQKLYILRNPVHREAQATLPLSEHDANTNKLVVHEKSVDHTEGGWPREVQMNNEDHVLRHRRRILHDENYIKTVRNLAPLVTHYVDQNNAIEMYQTYFAEMEKQEPVEKGEVRVTNVFRDIYHRPVSCVVWTHEKNSKLAVAYTHEKYPSESVSNEPNTCYIWDITNQTAPLHELQTKHPCWQLACSPMESEILIGGLENGTMCVFDVREGTEVVASSSVYNSHRETVTALRYVHSRTNTEFFSGSTDGQCLWWDSRNLSSPTFQIPISVKLSPGVAPNLNNAEGVSSLEFDRNLPTKFLCGTESGLVVNGNRMGRSHSEVLSSYWDAHSGPVRAVQRSRCTSRMFVTCGDWTVRVWSEEVRTAPIIVTKPYPHQVTDVAWAPQRYSCYMSVCEGGFFYYWDLLRKYREPVATLQVSKHPLTKIAPFSEGHSIAIGDNHGCVFLLQLSDNMTESGVNDKHLMSQIYERETRREQILDTRKREIHLKRRQEEEAEKEAAAAAAAAADDLGLEAPDEEETEEDRMDRLAEEQYFNIVKDELLQMEVTLTPSDMSII